ncbi:hypothetical protein [Streptomyces sp. 900105245]
MNLEPFYWPDTYQAKMVTEWLNLTPTHNGGILGSVLGAVATNKTIFEQLQDAGKGVDEIFQIATKIIKQFIQGAEAIEGKLEELATQKITAGSTVLERVDYILANSADPDVAAWNEAIDMQYISYNDHYIWASPEGAFAVFAVK